MWSEKFLMPQACNCIKKGIQVQVFSLTQVFSCEFCEIFKNTFFIERLWWRFKDFLRDISIWFGRFCDILFQVCDILLLS